MPAPIARWDSARDAWVTDQFIDLFSEHSAVFSETWPTSGMTRGGLAFEPQTSELRTSGSGSSSSPNLFSTPTVVSGEHPGRIKIKPHQQSCLSAEVIPLMPTPRTSDTNGVGIHGQGGMDLRTAVSLLPTPSVADGMGGHATRSGDRSTELLLPGIARSIGESTAALSNAGKP